MMLTLIDNTCSNALIYHLEYEVYFQFIDSSYIDYDLYGTWSLTGSRSRSGVGGPGGLVLVADGR